MDSIWLSGTVLGCHFDRSQPTLQLEIVLAQSLLPLLAAPDTHSHRTGINIALL